MSPRPGRGRGRAFAHPGTPEPALFSYIGRRLLYSVPVLFVASFLLFCATRLAFDPLAKFRVGIRDPQALARVTKRLGLDKPLVEQYWIWLKGAARGDLGVSARTGEEVTSMLGRGLGNTVQIIIWGVLVSLVVAVAIGVYSAVRQYSVGDYTFTGLSYVGIAMPPFWFGLIAIQFLAIWPKNQFDLANPPLFFIGLHSPGKSGFNLDYLRHLVLPILTLSVQIIASWSRFMRSSMLDVMASDYVRTARAKGLPRRRVVFKHAFRNALIPLTTIVAIDSALLFGGLIITERIFSIPGMGRLFFDALQFGDVYVVMGWLMVTAIIVIVLNLLADLFYGVLDPRIRLS